jgi:hypothetical protein
LEHTYKAGKPDAKSRSSIKSSVDRGGIKERRRREY